MGRDRRGLKIKLRNNLLMVTCVFSFTRMPSAVKKTKMYNKIIISDEIDYYLGLLIQFNQK